MYSYTKQKLIKCLHVLGILLGSGYSIVNKTGTIPTLAEYMVSEDMSNNQVGKQVNLKW